MKNKKGLSLPSESIVIFIIVLGFLFIMMFVTGDFGKNLREYILGGLSKAGEKVVNLFGGTPAFAGEENGGEGTGEDGGRKTYTLSVGSGGGVHTTPGTAGEYTVTVNEINSISREVTFSVRSATENKEATIKAKVNSDGCSNNLNLCIDVLSIDMDTNEVSFQVYAMTGEAGQMIVYNEVTRMQKGEKYKINGKSYTLKFYKTEGEDAWFWLDFPNGEHQNCDVGNGKDWWIKYIRRCWTCCKADKTICGAIEGIANDNNDINFQLINCDTSRGGTECNSNLRC